MQDAPVCPRCNKPSLAMALVGAKICGVCSREEKTAAQTGAITVKIIEPSDAERVARLHADIGDNRPPSSPSGSSTTAALSKPNAPGAV